MIALFKKEISVFFSTLIGYLIIALFLLVNGIILWTSMSSFNILDYGYANMDMFFKVSPLLFLLFIPAISMRVFTEEYNVGTIETLITKPISIFQLVFAKFLAVFCLVCLSIFPTIIYVISVYYLGETIGNLDLASIIGSYIGLCLLSSVFASISVYCSALSSNQIISFVVAILLCALFYFGFDLLSELSVLQKFDLLIQKIGISYHYQDLSKGLLSFSDVFYFISVSFLFLKLNEQLISNRKS